MKYRKRARKIIGRRKTRKRLRKVFTSRGGNRL